MKTAFVLRLSVQRLLKEEVFSRPLHIEQLHGSQPLIILEKFITWYFIAREELFYYIFSILSLSFSGEFSRLAYFAPAPNKKTISHKNITIIR
jgi:hypothetical protein